MVQRLIILRPVKDWLRKGSQISNFKESVMDPYLHTFIAVTLIAIAFYAGKFSGMAKGIQHALNHLIRYGVLTEQDILTANERHEEDRNR